MMHKNNFFIITGGPGAGKTTLLNCLEKRGYRCIGEGARSIICDQLKINGDVLPWKNLPAFKEHMLNYAIKSYESCKKHADEIVFFDGAILELVAYNNRTDTLNSAALLRAVQKMAFNNTVFIAPTWREIYCTDNERRQSFEESVEVYQAILDVYQTYGYRIIEIPKTSVEERADFILTNI